MSGPDHKGSFWTVSYTVPVSQSLRMALRSEVSKIFSLPAPCLSELRRCGRQGSPSASKVSQGFSQDVYEGNRSAGTCGTFWRKGFDGRAYRTVAAGGRDHGEPACERDEPV